ncbi:MAG TPA: potassium transporter TrkA [Candidatus Hydrogenedentes bacterium]|nr:potassium transporter TrkA [Candidatus Hydrogenedentota bacterium]
MKTPLRARWRYSFDTFMSRGTGSLILALAAVTAVLVAVAALVLALVGVPNGDGEVLPLGEALWQALMRAVDAGALGGDSGWGFRAVMAAVTLGGIFVLSALIGVINSGLEARFDELRKGRSAIVESGHSVILGWNDDIFAVLGELIEANASRRRACVAILAPRDKVEMEDELRERLGDTRTTRIVCRTGDPRDAADLAIVSVASCRAILILSGENGDAESIKTLLAVTSRPHDSGRYHCVAEILDPKNETPALIAAKGQARIILSADILARTIAQTCRQSGLSVVYEEFLDFGGSELYFKRLPELEGMRYLDAVTRFRSSAILGLVDPAGKPVLNPAPDTVVAPGWSVLALSEDDDTVIPDGLPRAPAVPAPARPDGGPSIELFSPNSLFVFLEWSYKLPVILKELNAYVGEGSRAIVVTSRAEEPVELSAVRGLCGRFASIEYLGADVTDRSTLEGLPLAETLHVVVLCNDEDFGAAESDSRALITLLHLRDLASRNGHSFSLTCELLDARTRELAMVAEADDFIVSDRLIGMLLVQVAENAALHDVFAELFSPEGVEVYFKPVGDYLEPGAETDGYAVFAAAAARGQSALGWRIEAARSDASRSFGVVLNPDKAARVRFEAGDRLIVLAGE